MINYIMTPEHKNQILEAGQRTALHDFKNGIDSADAHCPYRKKSNKEALWVTGYLMEVIRHAA